MSNDKSERKRLGEILATIIVLIIIASLGKYVLNISYEEPSDLETAETVHKKEDNKVKKVEGVLTLTMIDVGQGDSFLFTQNDQVALIDCGTRSTGKDVVEYLQSIGIKKIDYVFGTHPHDDHMGGMYDVITNFEIGKIILPKVKTGEVVTNWYIQLMQEIKNKKYKLEYAKIGTVYNLGNAIMKVIGPISEPNDNLNNYSTVLKVSFGEMDIIMTGDAEKEVEDEILKSGEYLDAEILKVGHHGSDSSTGIKFLDAISPDYALISAKIGNKYNHPIEETMQNLKNRKIKVYRTDENGTVILTITTDSVSFNCKPGNYLSGKELEERNTTK